MTEAQILELNFSAIEAMSGLFSIFIGLVSAYIVGLYFFLYKSPVYLKLITFVLLTFSLVFVGQSMSDLETRVFGLIEAWKSVEAKTTGIENLSQIGIPLPIRDALGWLDITPTFYDGTRIAIYTGWFVSLFVYLALFYATFFYRWPDRD